MRKRIASFCLALMVVIGLSCGCGSEKNTDAIGKYDGIYEITELLDNELYDEYMTDDGTLFSRLRDYQSYLAGSSDIEFYAFANNFIEVIGEDIPEPCVVNYGTEAATESRYEIDGESVTAAEAIQVSENFFRLFPMEIAEGERLKAADSEVIPVLLGSAYRDTFEPGDTFEAYVLCERRMLRVVGFLCSGEEFYSRSNGRMTAIDGYIVMLFEHCAEDTYAARASLLQQTCGFLAPENGREAAVRAVRKCLKDAGLEAWTDRILVNEKSLQNKLK